MNFSKQLQIYVERTNDALRRFIKSQLFFNNTHLLQVMQYGTLLGGKRLRPFLVYAIGSMFGVSEDILDVPAAAVECIHAYSLMHDDLPAMDDNDLRRNQPTCHMKFGEAQTILAGDALQTLAFSILSNEPMTGITDRNRLAMVSELSMASGVAGMCGGQALDIESEGKEITLEQLERIHRYKTGSLIRTAVRFGVLSAGDQAHYALLALDRYAEYVGLAFQVQDDILDVIGDTKKLGKRHGVDKQLKKNTYPSLLGIEQAKYKAKKLINNAYQSLNQLTSRSIDTSILKALADYVIHRDK